MKYMPEKKRILIFTDWYLPAYKAGGPVRSVANIIHNFKDEFDFGIIASDRDLGDNKAFDGINLDAWIEDDGAQLMYLSHKKQSYGFIKEIIENGQYDVIYFNSMFSFRFTILPFLVLNRLKYSGQVILAPRGMLGEGAMKIKSTKKKAFLALGKLLKMFSGITWHATSDQEANEIRKFFGKDASIAIAANIPTIYSFGTRQKELGELKLLFYSRISLKKNLLEALKVLQKGKFTGKLEFNIYGPIEDESYWNDCLEVIGILNESPDLKIIYHGAIKPEKAGDIFTENHIFYLPTRHENFGHVLAEALSSGMPLLISDQTPWNNLKMEKAGFDLPLLNMKMFEDTINFFLSMNNETYQLWSLGAKMYFEQKIQLDEIINDTRNVFLGS